MTYQYTEAMAGPLWERGSLRVLGLHSQKKSKREGGRQAGREGGRGRKGMRKWHALTQEQHTEWRGPLYTTMVGPLREQGTKQKGKKRQGVRKGGEWNELNIGTLRWYTTHKERERERELQRVREWEWEWASLILESSKWNEVQEKEQRKETIQTGKDTPKKNTHIIYIYIYVYKMR